MRIHGNDYASNDHVAFAEDLRALISLGFRVVPARTVVQWLDGDERLVPGEKLVAITFDDGPDFDFRDLPHPSWGIQRSMLNIMVDLRVELGAAAQPKLHATSFVIVSPDARRWLDRTCMVGRDWWRDDWWKSAIESAFMSIANHSWDHNHASLPAAEPPTYARGTFQAIDTFAAAEEQIAHAAAFLRANAPNPGTELFAYPYGEASEYLVREYFPCHGARIGIRAAFACGAKPVSERANRWLLPRYVFASDWKSPAELVDLLRDAGGC